MKLLVDTPEKVRVVMVQNITNDLTAFCFALNNALFISDHETIKNN